MKLFTDDEPHGVFFLIDNKSFYASCEAVARGLNPLKVPLVVLRTCLVSFKNYLQEGQYNHLKTAVKGTFTVFPKSPIFV
jgi:DNA polymerase V